MRVLIVLRLSQIWWITIAIDYWVFWVLNIVGVFLLAAFVFIQSAEFPDPKRFMLPMLVLLVSILLMFLPSPLRLGLPVVISPSYSTSFSIAKQALSQSPLRVVLGTGPGTFIHDYVSYHPQAINNTQFWSFRLDRAKSQLITTLAMLGVLGTLLWLATMVYTAVRALGRLIGEREAE